MKECDFYKSIIEKFSLHRDFENWKELKQFSEFTLDKIQDLFINGEIIELSKYPLWLLISMKLVYLDRQRIKLGDDYMYNLTMYPIYFKMSYNNSNSIKSNSDDYCNPISNIPITLMNMQTALL